MTTNALHLAAFTATGLLVSSAVVAHPTVISGNADAGANTIVTIAVGHGCDGFDTSELRVEIPSDVTSARPAPNAFGAATIVPALAAGWNDIDIHSHVHEFAPFFGDVQIVWRGESSAWSPNAHTMTQIEATDGVSVLDMLHDGDRVWVLR